MKTQDRRCLRKKFLPSITFQRWLVIRNGLCSCISSSLVVVSVVLTIHSHVVGHALLERR